MKAGPTHNCHPHDHYGRYMRRCTDCSVRTHASSCTDPRLCRLCRNEIPPVFLRDFIVFMVCIISTHPQPPPSEQLDKIHLMVCQEVCVFFLLCTLELQGLIFLQKPVPSVYNELPQSQQDANTERRHRAAIAHVREQESCHFCSGFIYRDDLSVSGSAPPSAGGFEDLHIKVYCFPPTTKDTCCSCVMCGHWFPHLLSVKDCVINFTEVKRNPWIQLCPVQWSQHRVSWEKCDHTFTVTGGNERISFNQAVKCSEEVRYRTDKWQQLGR